MIGIINYGLGNIKAFANIYKRLDIPYKIVSEADKLNEVTKLILPGVGAFDYAMKLLKDSGMREKIDDLVIEKKIPVLGVCVGMQIMGNASEEGIEKGLCWINGNVKRMYAGDMELPLPHMGWNEVNPKPHNQLFFNINTKSRFYFLHSYYFQCENEESVVAGANYGFQFACGINYQNIFGVQFHPEKSHQAGVQLLKNFANL